MANRTDSLATFQLAYIAFFPVIRETLPNTPKLVLAEILIYSQSSVTLLCFFYSITVNMLVGYQFDWGSNPVFLVSMGLTGLNILITVGLMAAHKLKWEPDYNKLPEGAIEAMKAAVIDTDNSEEWWNPACEE